MRDICVSNQIQLDAAESYIYRIVEHSTKPFAFPMSGRVEKGDLVSRPEPWNTSIGCSKQPKHQEINIAKYSQETNAFIQLIYHACHGYVHC